MSCRPEDCEAFRAALRALRTLGAVLARHPEVLVLSDGICEHVAFDRRAFLSFGRACPEPKDRSPIVDGASKAYAMPGRRVGDAAGPAPLLRAMDVVQSQSATSVCSIAEAATVSALTEAVARIGDAVPCLD